MSRTPPAGPADVEAYIAALPPAAQPRLREVLDTVRAVAPQAEERISYQMPAFFQQGVVAYVGAFQRHIGLYPPVVDDAVLRAEAAPYAGEKGNLRFPLDRPLPHDLIARIVRARLDENLRRASTPPAARRR